LVLPDLLITIIVVLLLRIIAAMATMSSVINAQKRVRSNSESFLAYLRALGMDDNSVALTYDQTPE